MGVVGVFPCGCGKYEAKCPKERVKAVSPFSSHALFVPFKKADLVGSLENLVHLKLHSNMKVSDGVLPSCSSK